MVSRASLAPGTSTQSGSKTKDGLFRSVRTSWAKKVGAGGLYGTPVSGFAIV